MGFWQDRNWSLVGQKLELGRTEMGSLAEVNYRNFTFCHFFCHFLLVYAIFSCFSAIHLLFLPIGRTVLQSILAQQLGKTELGNLPHPSLKMTNDKWLPPLKMTNL